MLKISSVKIENPDRDGAGTGAGRRKIIQHGSAGEVGAGILIVTRKSCLGALQRWIFKTKSLSRLLLLLNQNWNWHRVPLILELDLASLKNQMDIQGHHLAGS